MFEGVESVRMKIIVRILNVCEGILMFLALITRYRS